MAINIHEICTKLSRDYLFEITFILSYLNEGIDFTRILQKKFIYNGKFNMRLFYLLLKSSYFIYDLDL